MVVMWLVGLTMKLWYRSALERPMLTAFTRIRTAAVALTVASAVVVAGSVGVARAAVYRVQPGDTVSAIAARFGVSQAALVSSNHLANPNVVISGTSLVIPGSSGSGTPTVAAADRSTYIVVAGDTITKIAARFHVTQAALIAANDLSSPNVIVIGTSLVIPGRGPSGTGSGVKSGPLAGVYAPAAGPPHYPALLLAHSSRLALRPLFAHWSSHFGVPTGLLEGLAWMESGWQSNVVSSTGAIGIGQLEPSTVRFVSLTLLGLSTPLNPRVAAANIEMSAAYLAWMIRAAHGSVANALGGYYQGLVSLYASGPFPSTRNYVLVIGQLWDQIRSG
jgi:LysM repeat protein